MEWLHEMQNMLVMRSRLRHHARLSSTSLLHCSRCFGVDRQFHHITLLHSVPWGGG